MIRGLVDHAPSLAPDLDFVLLTNPAKRERLSKAPNVNEVPVSAAANGPVSMWFLPQFAELNGIDLFHATANTLPAGLEMPCVTTIHDIMWLQNPEWCDTSVLAPVKRWFFSHGIQRAFVRSARIATVSEASRHAIMAHDPTLAERLVVTRSGVCKRFRHDGQPPETLEAGANYVLVVGQFAPYKNHERALEAFALAFADNPHMRIVFVQRQGQEASQLERLAERLGVRDKLELSDSLPEAELIRLYSHATALLHPSLCEGFGNPLAEAMACGCPVITSNRSAMPEVTGGAALLIDPLDPEDIAKALRMVSGSTDEANRLRKAGLARAQELRWTDFARENIAIYRAVLAEN